MKTNLSLPIIIGASVIIVGGGGFFAGTKFQQSKQITQNSPFSAQLGRGRDMMRNGNLPQINGTNLNNSRMGFRPLSGEITASDDQSITVKMADGSSKIILISAATSINKASEAVKTDLTIGTSVAIFGQTNSDGSVTAQSIQLNPALNGQGFGMPPQGGQGIIPSPAPGQ